MSEDDVDIYKESKASKAKLRKLEKSKVVGTITNSKSPKLRKRPTAAVGGLDADIYGQSRDAFRGRKGSQLRERLEDFKEFNPALRLRKGGKLGKGSFKSKARYKRRK